MKKPLVNIKEATHNTQFWPRMYEALTENISFLKFLLPIIDVVRELTGRPANVSKKIAPSEAWPAPLLQEIPIGDASDFTGFVTKLKQKLDDNVRMVAVYGEAGAGKSRVAASLFQDPFRPQRQPVWFTGNDVEGLRDSLAKVADKHLCIVLDEDHQQGRNETFFQKVLTSSLMQEMRAKHQVVLALRIGTYEQLTLTEVDHVEVSHGLESLDAYEQWGKVGS